MKPRFESVPVSIGAGINYTAIVRVFPARQAPHVSADHPRYMSPGEPARIQIIRILNNAAADVTDTLHYTTRRSIEEAVSHKLGTKEVVS